MLFYLQAELRAEMVHYYPGSEFFSQPDIFGNVDLIRSLRDDISSTETYTVSFIISVTLIH